MITSSSCFRAAFASLVYAVTSVAAQEIPMTFESVPGDAVDQNRFGGYVVAESQFLGWSFQVDQPFEVSTVGGNFSGSGELFAALVSLSGLNAVPLGSPFLQEEVIAATTFEVVGFHEEVLVPLSVSLMPGVYGLVFGSGAFGADGQSTMSYLTDNPLSGPGIFHWDTSPRPRWVGSGEPTRFVVHGNSQPVPDSSPGLAGFLAFAVLLGLELRDRLRRAIEAVKS